MSPAAPTPPARRLRDVLEPVAALSFYSDPSTAAYAALGLTDFLPAYVWSRSSVLGDADAAVVVASFGVWEPGLVTANLATGRRACSLAQIRDATQDGAGAAAREVLSDVDEHLVAVTTAVLWRGLEAADVAARPLFAGNRAWSWPDDPYAGLWRAATAWRELRGDSNLAACVAAGVSGLEANVLNELDSGYPLGEYTATRNWSPAQIGAAAEALRQRGLLRGDELSDDGRRFRERIERATDDAVQPAVTALGTDLDPVVDRLAAWSRLVVDRGWFPADDRKRAAG